MELDKGIQEKTEKFEKEKHTFLEQNKQLRVELEQVKGERDQLHGLRKDQESELTELRQNKELLSQWEKQIADIIQWVTEEKDARWVWFCLSEAFINFCGCSRWVWSCLTQYGELG